MKKTRKEKEGTKVRKNASVTEREENIYREILLRNLL